MLVCSWRGTNASHPLSRNDPTANYININVLNKSLRITTIVLRIYTNRHILG